MQVPVPQVIVDLDAYFMKQSSLIPVKHFLDNDHGSAQGLRFQKKDVRASAKRKLVELAKERKRAKLNPNNDSVAQGRGIEGPAGANTAETEEGQQRTVFKLALGKGRSLVSLSNFHVQRVTGINKYFLRRCPKRRPPGEAPTEVTGGVMT
jgi:hypothetical protein